MVFDKVKELISEQLDVRLTTSPRLPTFRTIWALIPWTLLIW